MVDGQQIRTAQWADPDYISERYFFRPGDFWIGRNPHNADIAIGYRDDKHVLVCAGGRSGKGRSLIVNNLALWPGSTVVYDPKGELPEITAARRGSGNADCDGMGQRVFVLDPLRHSDVPEELRGYFDPLSALDPEDKDGELSTWAKRIARSLIKMPEGPEAAQWTKRGIRFVSTLIMHVVTFERYHPNERNILKVCQLILQGYADIREGMLARLPASEHGSVPDAYVLLLKDMITNDACDGKIAEASQSLLHRYTALNKFFEYIRDEAADQLDWINSEGIRTSLTGINRDGSMIPQERGFVPADLKRDPKGISVFIVMPLTDFETYEPWVQTVLLGVFAGMREKEPRKPKAGSVLCVLDEFSSLGQQEYLAQSLDNIASSGMKLALIVQNLGSLKKSFGDKIESFYTNCGLELYFGKIGDTAMDRLQKELGETEVVRLARTKGISDTEGSSQSTAIAFGNTSTKGGSETESLTSGTSLARGQQWNWSDGVNWSDSDNWGQSDGRSMGRNYGPGIFHLGLAQSTNYGSNLSRNRGGAHTRGGSRIRGGGGSTTQTEQQSRTLATGSTWSNSESRTETKTSTLNQSRTLNYSIAETFHKKPLLEPQEFYEFLAPIREEDMDNPAYPGLILVRIEQEAPFFLRRSNYDQDAYFERCFTPDQSHGFVSVDDRPLLGYEYTEDHLIPIKSDSAVVQAGFEFETAARPYAKVKRGDVIATYSEDGRIAAQWRAPFAGRIVPTRDPETDEPILQLNAKVVVPRKMRALKDDAFWNEVSDRLNATLVYRNKRRAEKRAAEEAEKARQDRISAHYRKINEKLESFDASWKKALVYGLALLILSPMVFQLWGFLSYPFNEHILGNGSWEARKPTFLFRVLMVTAPIQVFFVVNSARGDMREQIENERNNVVS